MPPLAGTRKEVDDIMFGRGKLDANVCHALREGVTWAGDWSQAGAGGGGQLVQGSGA